MKGRVNHKNLKAHDLANRHVTEKRYYFSCPSSNDHYFNHPSNY